ncbi:MAG TPA: PAS domain S-box protein [Acidimicrobiales bacterium]|nr:PAS domain S-box protein [Acidimicrobiales bacterium]
MDATNDARPRPVSKSTEEILLDSPDGVVIVDANGIIRSMNLPAEVLFGYGPAQLVGQSIAVLIPEAGVAARRDDFDVIALGEPPASAAVRDSSERNKIEAEFPGLLGAAQDAIVAVDDQGLIHLVNHQAEALFGYASDELIGQPLETLIPHRARAAHVKHRAEYFANPTARAMGAGSSLSARRKDGTEFPVDVSLSSTVVADEVIVSATVRDITDRKRIEDERANLDARVLDAQRDSERAMLAEQLQQAQRLETVGQLAGGVAHDFNNLLAGIMNYAGLVSSSLKAEMATRGLTEDESFVTLVQDVDEITKVAKRAVALTRQLLIFSQRKVLQPEVLDLSAVVADIGELLRRTIGESVALHTAFTSDLTGIKADRGQVDQVVMNLAVNARDAMPHGGTLQIETASFDADESYSRSHAIAPGAYVRLTVSDTGTGMTAEVAARAFEPFFTTKPNGGGTGLGLATVYGIVTQAGGAVTISSEVDVGTTIRVDFPATPDADAAPRTVLPDVPSAKGETVLLVEDEEIVREPVRRMLSRSGYTVLSAPHAAAALAIVHEHRSEIDLLLTDVVMPGGSGKALWDDVIDLRPEIKVLFMSGYNQDLIANEGVLDEGVSLIEKPFSADDLLRKVRDVLDVGP